MAWLTGTSATSNQRDLILEKNAILAVNIVREALGERVEHSDNIYRTLLSCVSQVLSNCEAQMSQAVSQLDVSRGISCDKFAAAADELFEADKGYIIRWERIITLFAFTWVLSKHLRRYNMSETSTNVSKLLASYLNEKISLWIQQTGGWVIIFNLNESLADW